MGCADCASRVFQKRVIRSVCSIPCSVTFSCLRGGRGGAGAAARRLFCESEVELEIDPGADREATEPLRSDPRDCSVDLEPRREDGVGTSLMGVVNPDIVFLVWLGPLVGGEVASKYRSFGGGGGRCRCRAG